MLVLSSLPELWIETPFCLPGCVEGEFPHCSLWQDKSSWVGELVEEWNDAVLHGFYASFVTDIAQAAWWVAELSLLASIKIYVLGREQVLHLSFPTFFAWLQGKTLQ